MAAPRRNTKASSTSVRRITRGKIPLEIGSLWAGRYRVVDGAGLGASGWVLRARDEEVDVDVALKLVSPNLLQTEDERNRFVKALRTAKKLHHPNVVRIYDDGREGDQLYYTMPFLEGLTLRKIIDLRVEKGQQFTYGEVLPILGQLATAIDAWQRLGLHGALRPHNVVVLPDVLKVTGLAHMQGLPQRPFTVLQTQNKTAEYLAPEIRRHESVIDRRADIFSAAVIFGEMLTGQVYGRDPNSWSLTTSKLSRRLQAALRTALAEAPGNRFESGAAFFEAIAEAVAEVAPEVSAQLNAGNGSGMSPDLFDDSSEPSNHAAPSPSTPSAPPAVPTPMDESSEPSASVAPVLELEKPVAATPPRRAIGNARATRTLSDKRRNDERRGTGRKRIPSVVLIAGTVLLAAVAVSAARWYRYIEATRAAEQGPAHAALGDSGLRPLDEARTASDGLPPGALAVAGAPVRVEAPTEPPSAGAEVPPEPSQPSAPTVASDATPPAVVGAATPAPTPDAASRLAALGAKPAPAPATPSAGEKLSTKPGAGKVEPPPQPAPPKEAPARACPPGMVAIKDGSFTAGTDSADPMRGFGDVSSHEVKTGAYCVDIYEFPNQRGKAPAVNFTWTRAKKMCESLGKRLCTESEWERACKGPQNFRFPFGNKYDERVCNISEGGKTAAAGEFNRCRSGFGVADMAGNVAEWTGSRWSDDVSDKVVKGGAADQASFTARCSARANESAGAKSPTLGFRCCADLE